MDDENSTLGTPHRNGRGQFPKGSSGNRKGRPKGSRNEATVLAEQLLDGEAEEITRVCIKLAKEGDRTALRMVMERLLPRRRGRPIQIDLPKIETVADLDKAYDIVIEAIGNGDISPDEATVLLPLLEGKLEVAKARMMDDIWPNGAGLAGASNEKPTA